MVGRCTLAIHLVVIVEEVRIDLVKHEGLLHYVVLKEDEERGRDPINKCPCRPSVREWEMQKLQYLEEATEPIYKPVLILFGDPSLKSYSEFVYLHLG
jgi:hypothetical protein